MKSKESTGKRVVVEVDRSLELVRDQVEKPFRFRERFRDQQKESEGKANSDQNYDGSEDRDGLRLRERRIDLDLKRES